MTTRIATALRLPPEALAEYERRHNEMGEAMRSSIAARGGRNFSIFAAPDLESVIIYVEVDDVELWAQGAQSEITKAWWAYMAEIMPTNDDLSPVANNLPLIFHLT